MDLSKPRLHGLDLFSGIGGNTLALRDYIKTIAYCEQDKHAQSVLLSRMGDGSIESAPIWDDVTSLKGDMFDLPIDIIVGGFPCFVADTMVFTKNGYKPIQDIEIGEFVLTHKRRWRQVTQKHVTENRQLRKVDGTGFLVTKTTDEHPYYVRQSKLIRPKKLPSYREFSDPDFIPAKDIKGKHVGITFIPDIIDDDHSEDFWWLVGRCIACGWCVERQDRSTDGYAKVVVCCGLDKVDELEERISRCYHATKDEGTSVHKYHITNKEFADFFSQAGIGALNKHIPNDWLMLPKEKLKALLDGYFAGDGSEFKSKSGRMGTRCTTVSKKLALTLQMAILKCYGIIPSLFYYKVAETTVIEGRTVNQNPQYQVQFSDLNRSSYVDSSGEYGWGICRKSDGTDEFATVYNIGVEEDESYIANGAIVHNCQDISCAGKGVGLEGKRSGLFYEIMRLADELKPTFLFLENVPAIRTRGLDRVLEELTNAGYDSRWCMLSASDVGAFHQRERWFLLAAKRDRLTLASNETGDAQGSDLTSMCGREITAHSVGNDGETSSDAQHTGWDGTSEQGSTSASVCRTEIGENVPLQSQGVGTSRSMAGIAGDSGDGGRGALAYPSEGRHGDDVGSLGDEKGKGESHSSMPSGNSCQDMANTGSIGRGQEFSIHDGKGSQANRAEQPQSETEGWGGLSGIPAGTSSSGGDAEDVGMANPNIKRHLLEQGSGEAIESQFTGTSRDGESGRSKTKRHPLSWQWDAIESDMGRSLNGFSHWLDNSQYTQKLAARIVSHAKYAALDADVLLNELVSGVNRADLQDAWLDANNLASDDVFYASLFRVKENWSEVKAKEKADKQAKSLQELVQQLKLDVEEAWTSYSWVNAKNTLLTWSPGWESGIARTASGVPHRVDRLKRLGNAVVPIQARMAFEILLGLRVKPSPKIEYDEIDW